MTSRTVTGSSQLAVGVLGGMGPEATLDFFAKLLAATPAQRDQDRLRVLIDNNPKVPNRNEAVAGTGDSPGPVLAEMARGLELAGADFLVMPCNAAHAFAGDISGAVNIPFLSIIQETATEAVRQNPGLKTVGLLAAAGCLDADLYQAAFAARGVEVEVPAATSRDVFMDLLYRIKRGEVGDAVRQSMAALAQGLIDEGAQAIIAGCTEVPLVLSEADISRPLVNSTDVLVSATVEFAAGQRQEPAAGQ